MAPDFKRDVARASAAGLALVALMVAASPGRTATPSPSSIAADAAAEAKRQGPKSTPSPTGPAPCVSGEPRDETGACPVVDDTPATRGFELYSGALPPPGTRPPPMAAADNAPAPADTPACGDLCDLKIGFRSGSSALTRPAEATLLKFAQRLATPEMADKHFEIAGHTDASGSAARNLALSQARADAVVAFLVSHGAPATRLSAKGYGSQALLLPNLPLDARNRRVEARVTNQRSEP